MGDTSDFDPLKSELFDVNADLVHAIMELVSDGIWDWDANTGFVYRNPGWYEMLGYDHHSLENTVFTWESVIHPDDYPHVMKLFDDYIRPLGIPAYRGAMIGHIREQFIVPVGGKVELDADAGTFRLLEPVFQG